MTVVVRLNRPERIKKFLRFAGIYRQGGTNSFQALLTGGLHTVQRQKRVNQLIYRIRPIAGCVFLPPAWGLSRVLMRLLQLTQDTLLHLPNRALVLIILRMRYTPAVADGVGCGLNCPVRRHRKLLPGAGVLNGEGAVLPPA